MSSGYEINPSWEWLWERDCATLLWLLRLVASGWVAWWCLLRAWQVGRETFLLEGLRGWCQLGEDWAEWEQRGGIPNYSLAWTLLPPGSHGIDILLNYGGLAYHKNSSSWNIVFATPKCCLKKIYSSLAMYNSIISIQCMLINMMMMILPFSKKKAFLSVFPKINSRYHTYMVHLSH